MTFSEELEILKELRDYLLQERLREDGGKKTMTLEDVNLSILHAYSTTLILLLESPPNDTDINRIHSLRHAIISRLESACHSRGNPPCKCSHPLKLYWNRMKTTCYRTLPFTLAPELSLLDKASCTFTASS